MSYQCKHKWSIEDLSNHGEFWHLNICCEWCNLYFVASLKPETCDECGDTSHHFGECVQ